MKTYRAAKNWLPVVIWMLVIFTASTDLMSAEHTSRFIGPFLHWLVPDISAEAIARAQFFIRKLAHLTEYAILAALLWRALRGSWATLPNERTGALALLCAALFAASDEFHQSFVASRTGTPRDVVIDVCGAALGLLLSWFLLRGKKRRTTSASAA